MITLTILVKWANAYIIRKFKRVDLKCYEGANRMVKLAKDAGYAKGRIRKVSGFFGSTQHNWTIDTKTGIIYDPTVHQFWGMQNSSMVIKPGDPAYKRYDEVPFEYMDMVGWRPSFQFDNWMRIRPWIRRGLDLRASRGEDMREERVTKTGVPYTYIQHEAHFSVLEPECMRAMLVYPNKRGFYISAVNQRMMLVGDRVIFPTKLKRYLYRNGISLVREKGKWVKDEQYTAGSLLHSYGFINLNDKYMEDAA